jgi:hypothetical protein
VEEVQASSELILRGLQSGTKYKVRIRVKLDGISYSGYWSAWTDPVLMETMPGGKLLSPAATFTKIMCLSRELNIFVLFVRDPSLGFHPWCNLVAVISYLQTWTLSSCP